MKLSFLGGTLEVGRSAVLVETDSGERLVLDYGIKIGKPTLYPPKIKDGLDAAIISHAHLDHSGFLPALYDNMKLPTICTAPTSALTTLLLKDSMKLQPNVPFRSSSLKRVNSHFSP
ncbi:MAG: MBL fold metallo-hydrolase, partial [Candidatus Micrarchaeota archaeon]|nr:MBL fold metallo-hydrolase [Candidatus Micrarchaeota archaeon]